MFLVKEGRSLKTKSKALKYSLIWYIFYGILNNLKIANYLGKMPFSYSIKQTFIYQMNNKLNICCKHAFNLVKVFGFS